MDYHELNEHGECGHMCSNHAGMATAGPKAAIVDLRPGISADPR